MSGCVFVVGAGGRLGAAIVEGFGDRRVIAHTRATLDITDAGAVTRAVEAVAPDVIVNCAAFNWVDEAEDRPIDAFAVNAFAVRSLARAAEAVDAVLVHYGSDFVFDGNATEPYDEAARPSPRSTYGLSKLLTNESLASGGQDGTVVDNCRLRPDSANDSQLLHEPPGRAT